ncbi:hypothetical protein WAI453_013725 [Rhynchosporium graminicola]
MATDAPPRDPTSSLSAADAQGLANPPTNNEPDPPPPYELQPPRRCASHWIINMATQAIANVLDTVVKVWETGDVLCRRGIRDGFTWSADIFTKVIDCGISAATLIVTTLVRILDSFAATVLWILQCFAIAVFTTFAITYIVAIWAFLYDPQFGELKRRALAYLCTLVPN